MNSANLTEKVGKRGGFSSFDFFSVLGAILLVVAISVPIVQKKITGNEIKKARVIAEGMADEVLRKHAPLQAPWQKQKGANRSIASLAGGASSMAMPLAEDGSIGRDPWGQPYKFAWIRNAYGIPTHMLVWSAGPNGQFETPRSAISGVERGLVEVGFARDDLGYVRALR
ncbi:MAG: hypothetical protein COT74_05205 [Bdellovibrionales bacterium CG10_big_fil_rev_8_21_14_0_10_45_34]|nr:MAG: hypothetical protein COT74_05205 [Bdellovibrionales bacterium CG10_big_fil_rev_8_21_14_0_10_45_34]